MPDVEPQLMIDDDGRTVPVAPEDVADYSRTLGYLPASEEQAKDYKLNQEMQSPLNQAKAFGSGAASALSFGATDLIDPAAQAALEKANPGWHALGSAAGIAGGLAIPGLAEASAPALIAKAGRGAAEMAPATAKVLRGALAVGTEGALYGGQQVVHEAALGDPNLTAESALTTVLGSALAGGALGGAGGLAGHLIGRAAQELTGGELAQKVGGWLGDFEGDRWFKAAGGIQGDLTRLTEQKGIDGVRQIMREGADLGLVDALSTPAQTLERSQDLQRGAGGAMSDLLKAADAKITGSGDVVYRGTGKGGESGRWWTSDPDTAQTFADKMAGKVVSKRISFDNPLEVDAKGAPWTRIEWMPAGNVAEQPSDALTSTDGIGRWAESHGHDGAIIRNVRDASRKPIDVYINIKGKLNPLESRVGPEIASVLDRARKDILAPLAANPLEQGAASEVGRILGAYKENFPNGVTFSDLHGLRRQLDDKIYGLRGAMDPLSSTLKDSLHDLRGIVSDALSDGLENAGADGPWRLLNRQYEVASTFCRLGGKGVLRAVGNNLVSPTEWLGALAGGIGGGPVAGLLTAGATALARRHSAGALGWAAKALGSALRDPAEEVIAKTASAIAAARQAGSDSLSAAAGASPEMVATLSALHGNNQRLGAKLTALVGGIVKRTGIAKSEIAANIPREFESSELTRAAYDKRVKQIQQAAIPEVMAQHIAKATSDLQEHAPETAQAYSVAYPRAVMLLQQSVPQQPSRGVLGPKLEPSKAQQRQFLNETNAIIKGPTHVIKRAALGLATPAEMQKAAQAYPSLAQSIAQAATEHIAKVGPENVPRAAHAALSALVGQPLDAANLGPAILRNQIVFAQHAPQQHATGGTEKLDVAKRYETASQSSAGRES